MKIAFFTDSYLPNVDGVVTSVCNTRKELERRGHEVFIFSPGTKQQKKENNDDHVYYFTSTSFKPYPDYRIALFNFLSPIKVVKEYDFDIIHSHGIATTGLAAIKSSQKLGIPAIATFHTLIPNAAHYITHHQQLQGIVHNMIWKYLVWYYSHYKKVIVPTNYVKKTVEQKGVKNTILNPSGIDLSKFSKNSNGEDFRKSFKIKKDTKIILHVGRVALEKNLEELIEVAPSIMNIIPSIKIVLVGKGPAFDHYNSLVNKKGLSQYFLFTGYLNHELLASAYSAASVFVFPSMFDTQGLAVLEALASGTPAVVKKNSAASEYIEEGKNGYIYNDHFDCAEKIAKAIENKEKIKNATIDSVKQFDIRITVDLLLDVYNSVLQKKSDA